MIDNKLDFEEQEKNLQAVKEKLKTQIKNGFIEIAESDEELIIDPADFKTNIHANLKRVKI
jgi:hypothetical protein